MKNPTYRSHIGLHFTNAFGVRHCSMQLLNSENKAVAIADFENRGGINRPAIKCVRFLTEDSVATAAVEWRDGLLRAPLWEMLQS